MSIALRRSCTAAEPLGRQCRGDEVQTSVVGTSRPYAIAHIKSAMEDEPTSRGHRPHGDNDPKADIQVSIDELPPLNVNRRLSH
jgi:hypothetical protein